MSFFSLKTDQNSLRLRKIMLATGAHNSAVHSFQTLTIFFSKLSKHLMNWQCIGNVLNFKQWKQQP